MQADGWSSTKRAILAGLLLLAEAEYHPSTYGSDWDAGHALLKQWVNNMKNETWAVGSEMLEGPERREGWAMLSGRTQ